MVVPHDEISLSLFFFLVLPLPPFLPPPKREHNEMRKTFTSQECLHRELNVHHLDVMLHSLQPMTTCVTEKLVL